MDSILGVVYPLHKKVIDFMFSNDRDVFVKYTTYPNPKKSLRFKKE